VDDARSRPVRPIRTLLAVTAAVLVIGLGLAGCGAPGPGPGSQMNRQAGMVMPFDLNATTHTFTTTPDGGVEQVVANDPADTTNTAAIRAHLRDEAGKFSAGDYSDPARIHGADMPGLAEVAAGALRIGVRYDPVPAGARITYSATDPTLVNALHIWFGAQTSDHDMPGMGG